MAPSLATESTKSLCEAVPLRKSVPFRSKLGLSLGLRR
jgi:hypothetical protein